jgi:HEAT repeat protein
MAVAHALLEILLAGSFVWPAPAGSAAGAPAREDAERLRAVLALAAADPARARALLVPALTDRDAAVRVTAARLLVRRGAPEATAAATAWLGAPLPRDRLLGLEVLLYAPELTATARRALERTVRDGDAPLRIEALDVLVAHPDAPSSGARFGTTLGVLLGALDDENREVRVRAVRALGATRDARAALPLVERLADADRLVQAQAAVALGALGDRRVVPALLRELGADARDRGAAAIEALGRLGDPAAVPALIQLARRGPLVSAARQALGDLGTPDAVDALLERPAEGQSELELRVALARAGARAVPRLVQELRTGTAAGARLAADVLGRIGDRRATPALVAAVERHAPAEPAALEALERLADPAAVPALCRAATEETVADLRVAALVALGAVGDDRALVVLPRALSDADAAIRVAAVGTARALGGPSVAAWLTPRLGDADGDVRRVAALALARLPWPSPAPELARASLAAALAVGTRAPASEEHVAVSRALGDVLERAVDPTFTPVLESAYLGAPTGARAALARGLAAARGPARGRAWSNARLADALLRDLDEDGALDLAPAAADALDGAALTAAEQVTLLAAFARAEDELRARLAPSLAAFPAGVAALGSVLGDAEAGAVVRAAAAWALAGVAGAAAALRAAADVAATTEDELAVAANARAALAVTAGRASFTWTSLRLTTPDGAPWPHRWVQVMSRAGAPVWARTDLGGRTRVAGVADGPVSVTTQTTVPTAVRPE